MGTILPESLEREIAALTTDEKRALATMLRRMVAEETSPGGTPGECPLCHHDRGGAICELVGRAHSTADGIFGALEGRIDAGTPVATDDLHAYDSVCERLGCPHEVRPAKPAKGERALGLANALHRRLADFLRPFNGVATRRLQRYLDWFCWTEQFRHGAADERELVFREALSGGYETTIREILNESRSRWSTGRRGVGHRPKHN